MKPIAQLPASDCKDLLGIFCDIDDTVTWEGRIVPDAFMAMARAQAAGLRVIPITGRPGAWVDHIARMWPVDGVVGENGGLWFYMKDGKMERHFVQDEATRRENKRRLVEVGEMILHRVPGTALASDQPYRDLDLAVDFCEDVPSLPDSSIDEIIDCFHEVGATCKASSIHVNGWFGHFDKLLGCRHFLADRFGEDLDEVTHRYAYFGDSANDEPMFEHFPLSIGVANIRNCAARMETLPAWVCSKNGGHGYAEGVGVILQSI
ncbi:MAG: HAD-IIB family hydrolase [Proteobacteria bacterium]|nr:HAD-IIB family hydrolase [Pseudomonadota bacterium]